MRFSAPAPGEPPGGAKPAPDAEELRGEQDDSEWNHDQSRPRKDNHQDTGGEDAASNQRDQGPAQGWGGRPRETPGKPEQTAIDFFRRGHVSSWVCERTRPSGKMKGGRNRPEFGGRACGHVFGRGS